MKQRIDPAVAQARARLAATVRHHPRLDHSDLRRELDVERLVVSIRELKAAHRLTFAQVTRLVDAVKEGAS